jgi:hypothetical protein
MVLQDTYHRQIQHPSDHQQFLQIEGQVEVVDFGAANYALSQKRHD